MKLPVRCTLNDVCVVIGKLKAYILDSVRSSRDVYHLCWVMITDQYFSMVQLLNLELIESTVVRIRSRK